MTKFLFPSDGGPLFYFDIVNTSSFNVLLCVKVKWNEVLDYLFKEKYLIPRFFMMKICFCLRNVHKTFTIYRGKSNIYLLNERIFFRYVEPTWANFIYLLSYETFGILFFFCNLPWNTLRYISQGIPKV